MSTSSLLTHSSYSLSCTIRCPTFVHFGTAPKPHFAYVVLLQNRWHRQKYTELTGKPLYLYYCSLRSSYFFIWQFHYIPLLLTFKENVNIQIQQIFLEIIYAKYPYFKIASFPYFHVLNGCWVGRRICRRRNWRRLFVLLLLWKVTCFKEYQNSIFRKKRSLLNEGIFSDPCRLSIIVGT